VAIIFVAVLFWAHAGYQVPACTHLRVEPMNAHVFGFTDRSNCSIHINSLISVAFSRGAINKLCTTVTHEMGHMLGKNHTKRGIMAAKYPNAYIPRGCRRLRAPQRVRTGQSVKDLSHVPAPPRRQMPRLSLYYFPRRDWATVRSYLDIGKLPRGDRSPGRRNRRRAVGFGRHVAALKSEK
jgi:hypothetical protein